MASSIADSIVTTYKGAVVPWCQPTPWFAGTRFPSKIELRQPLDGTMLYSCKEEREEDQF